MDSDPEHESTVKEVVGVWTLDWLVWGSEAHWKVAISVSRNQLALEGIVSAESAKT